MQTGLRTTSPSRDDLLNLIKLPLGKLLTSMETRRTVRSKKVVNRVRRGEFNLTWLIVAVVAVVIALVIVYYVFAGGMSTLGTTNTPAIQASEANGVLTVNIKATGTGNLAIYNVAPYSNSSVVSCSSVQYFLDGQAYTPPSSGPLVVISPGQAFTVIETNCSVPVYQVTSVEVVTNAGVYVEPVS